MTKIDIISGFLGAGKTTLIKKLLKEAMVGEKSMLIENEFGEIGIDGGFLKESGIQITEMNSGCICCSLVGDFETSLKEALDTYHPDRIIIEPSGVGKLSDVFRAVKKVADGEQVILNSGCVVVDAKKIKMYSKNFGEFYNDQIANAGTIILSRTGEMSEEKIAASVDLIRSINATANIITTDWDKLDGKQILAAMEKTDDMAAALLKEVEEHHHHHHHHDEDEEECACGCGHHHDEDEDEHEHHHHHHHDEDEEECACGCGHHHDEDEDEHEHHHHHHHDEDEEECACGCGHHHDEDEDEHEHHHHHHDEDEEECGCGCGGHHHHHHHHHADDVFTSWGMETTASFTEEEIREKLEALEDFTVYGTVLRSKGIVAGTNGEWIHFDYVPEEWEVRTGAADVTGKICVIGAKLNETALKELFAK